MLLERELILDVRTFSLERSVGRRERSTSCKVSLRRPGGRDTRLRIREDVSLKVACLQIVMDARSY